MLIILRTEIGGTSSKYWSNTKQIKFTHYLFSFFRTQLLWRNWMIKSLLTSPEFSQFKWTSEMDIQSQSNSNFPDVIKIFASTKSNDVHKLWQLKWSSLYNLILTFLSIVKANVLHKTFFSKKIKLFTFF